MMREFRMEAHNRLQTPADREGDLRDYAEEHPQFRAISFAVSKIWPDAPRHVRKEMAGDIIINPVTVDRPLGERIAAYVAQWESRYSA